MALTLAKDLPLLCPPLSWTDSLQSGGWDILHFTRAPVQAVGVPPAGAQCLKGRALVPGSSVKQCRDGQGCAHTLGPKRNSNHGLVAWVFGASL